MFSKSTLKSPDTIYYITILARASNEVNDITGGTIKKFLDGILISSSIVECLLTMCDMSTCKAGLFATSVHANEG